MELIITEQNSLTCVSAFIDKLEIIPPESLSQATLWTRSGPNLDIMASLVPHS